MFRSLPWTLILLSTSLPIAWSHDPKGGVPPKDLSNSETEVIDLPLPPNLDATEEEIAPPPGDAEQLPPGKEGEEKAPRKLQQFQRPGSPPKPNAGPGLLDEEPAPPADSQPVPGLRDPFEARPPHRHALPERPGTRVDAPRCPVSGHPLDRFGAPYSVHFQGETVYACSRACALVIQQFPEDYFSADIAPSDLQYDWGVWRPYGRPCQHHHCPHHYEE